MQTLTNWWRHYAPTLTPKAIGATFAEVRTVQQSVALPHEECPCLLAIARQGEQARREVVTLLSAHLLALQQFLNLKNGMSSDALIFAAESVLNEFGGGITWADVKIVLDGAKMGKYGEYYERLSCPQVVGWFRKYAEQRAEAAETWSRNSDARVYGNGGDGVLARMGYEVVKDGRLRVNADKLARASASDEPKADEAEYMQFKKEMIANDYKLNK